MRRIVVLVGGSGPERPALERIIHEHDLANVRLLGPIPDDALPEVYRAADVFALPTRTGEGLGLVVLEAFASGIPVIATRGGGQEELVGIGHTGLLSPPLSADALADAAALLEARPDLTQQMGQEARRWVMGMDWQSNAIRLERVLCEAIGERSQADAENAPQASWRAAS